jgi:uncharacterized protein YbjT (DUF2867 family)
MNILVLGATGSIGRLVVAEALQRGHSVRALVRDAGRASCLLAAAEIVVGDVTRPETLGAAVDGIDAVIATLGADGGGKAASEAVYYGGIRDVLAALGKRPARIALMTAIGVTNRTGSYNRNSEAHDWKRRAERLIRASGRPYTIVRPGWFDYNEADERLPVLLQGDTRQSGTPQDGAIARDLIAAVLVCSLESDAALNKTFELIATRGATPANLDPLFEAVLADPGGAIDGVGDADNMPPADEPNRVKRDLATEHARHQSRAA